MKKFLSLFFILFCAYFSYGQQFALPPRSTPVVTVQDSRWRGMLTAYMPHTHGLTLNGGLDTLGAFIYEDSSRHVWYRDSILSGGHKWTMVVSPSDISITGLIQQGANITITGLGTQVSPYIINSSGGGGGGTIVGAGNLAPLFTTGVAFNQITFAFQNTAAFRFFGNPTNANGPPFYFGTDATMHFVSNVVGVDTAFIFANLNFYNSITQVDSFTFTLNTPTGRHDTVQIKIPTFGYVATLDNGLTLNSTDGQWGGTLLHNTTINGAGFYSAFSGGRLEAGQGAPVASANNLTLGNDGNTFPITGVTQINALTTANWQGGAVVYLTFSGTPTLKNNTIGGGGTAPMLLAGGIDYSAAPGDLIGLLYDGSFWHEITRKLASSGGVYVFSNGLQETPAGRPKWGGTLIQNTTIAGAGFYSAFSGGRMEVGMGASVAAANNLVVGNDGNLFPITGNTQINALTTLNYQAGSHIELVFSGTPTLKNNTAGGVNTAPMLLAGSIDYTAAPGDLIGFSYDGTVWHETNRKLAGSVTALTFNNGLTATGTLVQFGGTLIQNTTLDASTFQMSFTGSNGTKVIGITSTGGGTGIIMNSNGDGLRSFTSAAGTAVYGQSSSVAVFGFSSGAAGTGVFGQASGGGNASAISGQALAAGTLAGSFLYNDATVNTVVSNTQFNRATSSSAATITAGFGESVDFIIQTTNGSNFLSNQFISKWTDPTTATRTAQFSIAGANGGTVNTLWTLDGNGNITTTGGYIDNIVTTAAGSYVILANDLTVVATGTTSTWTFPTAVKGRRLNLVNQGSGSVTLGTAVTISNGTTSTTLTAGSNYDIQYDGTNWRKIN